MNGLPAFHRSDGTRDVAGEDSSWSEWVSPSKVLNFCNDDPCLDWLDLYGEERGFIPDTALDGYDPRTDFSLFVKKKGQEFEAAVLKYLGARADVLPIAHDAAAIRDRAAVERTWNALAEGREIVAQGVLWNPENRTYGAADLLVRSDILARLFPSILPLDEAAEQAPRIQGAAWHYRIVDIKFTTLNILKKNGHASTRHLKHMLQVLTYSEALGRLQGYLPSASYLIGRAWEQGGERGVSAMERLAKVEHTWAARGGVPELMASALAWVRRVRTEGKQWIVLPEPSVDELRPNLRNTQMHYWTDAKQRIAAALEDVTMLPRVNSAGRLDAFWSGVRRWSDPACTATCCGVSGITTAPLVDAVIRANQSPPDGPAVFPARVTVNEHRWRTPARAEFFVDFESVSDIDDDFQRFPEKGGDPLIFMIGCGHLEGGQWTFRSFTAAALTAEEECAVISRWLAHLDAVCRTRGCSLAECRLFHWSHAEESFLATAYNSAAQRHGRPDWLTLPWVDLLRDIVKAQPLTVRGAFDFGLKSVAAALHSHGLISTKWPDASIDGLRAMVGAWTCAAEAREKHLPMTTMPVMKQVVAYNEVDCKAMADILEFLRRHR